MPKLISTRDVHPARDGGRPLTAEVLWSVPRVGAPEPTPDGVHVVVPITTYSMETNRGTTRLWLADVAGTETPRPLTAEDQSASAPAVSPDGSHIAFLRKTGDPEHAQVHVLPLVGGEARRLSDLPLGAADARWLPDGSGLIVAAALLDDFATIDDTRAEAARRQDDPVKAHITERSIYRVWDHWVTDGKSMHLFHVDAATGLARDLTPNARHLWNWLQPAGQFDVAPDGSAVVFAAAQWDADANRMRGRSFHVDVAGGTLRELTQPDGHATSGPRFTPDGSAVVYGVRHDPNFYADRVRLVRHDLASGAESPVLTDWDRSPDSWRFDADGSLWLTAESEARKPLWRLEDGADSPEQVTHDGVAAGMSALPQGGVVFTRADLSRPTEAFVVRSGSTTRITHFTDTAMDGVALGAVQEMTFEGAGGETVQMFVVHPAGRTGPADDGPAPLVQVVHGGPHGISADSFHPRWNAHLFAAPGYVAALVNFQGSTSFGQDFAQRIQGAWGERPYEDVMRATDVLIDAGLADPDRMAAAGGSYGGYLVSYIATQTNRFKAIVNHAGVFDFNGMFASDFIQSRNVSVGGHPWEPTEAFERWNPVRHGANANSPMLVIHGDLDFRVPVTQGLLCYAMLKERGVPARLVHYPDENHWVLKPQNSLLWYREVHAWLARFIAETGESNE